MHERDEQHARDDAQAIDAARMVHSGEAPDIDTAIARMNVGASPSRTAVRCHLEAMRQADVGLGAWWRDRLDALESLVECIDTISFLVPEATVLLTGRTGQGHVDSSGPATGRVIGVDAPALCDAIEGHGMPPPEVGSVRTALGSMPRVHLVDRQGRELQLLVLPDVPDAHAPVNLVDGGRLSMLDRERFGEIVEAARRTTEHLSGRH